MEFHRTTVAQQYGRRTLVGNWFEDQVQQEQKVKEYIQRKDQGLLYSTPSNNPNANNGEADSQVPSSFIKPSVAGNNNAAAARKPTILY